jgi:hypothetical protein
MGNEKELENEALDFDVEENTLGDMEVAEESLDEQTEEATQDLGSTVDNSEETNEVETDSTSNKKDKKKKEKKAKANKKKTAKESENAEEKPVEQVEDVVLYIITDRHLPNMIQYYRERGVNVSNIFDSIEDARSALILNIEKSRLVILDTGMGQFSNMGTRRQIIDLIGISDEENRISVYYTDSVIKSEVEYSDEVMGREISWHKYRSTADVIAHILKHKNEHYVLNFNADKDGSDSKPVYMDRPGFKVDVEKVPVIGTMAFTSKDVMRHLDEESAEVNQLEAYEVHM